MIDTHPLAQAADTRDRLLAAALHAFGSRDYDGVSTREIVQAADANIAAISYHFGGKRGLYLDTVAYLAQRLRSGVGDLFGQFEQTVQADDRERCADLLCEFLGRFLELMLVDEVGRSAPGIILREQLQPSEAFDILYDTLLQPIHSALSRLVACCRGIAPTDREAITMTQALLGQTLIFRVGRTTLLKQLNQSAYTTSDIERFKAELATYYRAMLNTVRDHQK
jgi:TetR/AcrR family transcriptional regulator, regulator of cefoperazone and chloramphenicol sensitivity